MTWFEWSIFGLVLLGIEIATPGGFYVLFFGIGALLVGLVRALGGLEPDWLQWLSFTLLSVASLLLFRKRILQKVGSQNSSHKVDDLVGCTVTLLENISPGEIGKVELRGASWTGRNVGSTPGNKGQTLKVKSIDGLTLHFS